MFDKMSRKERICLHSYFERTRENRLKSLRLRLGSFSRKNALKTKEYWNCLCLSPLSPTCNFQSPIFEPRFDNSILQNKHFSLVFAHFSTWGVARISQARNQSPRAALAISACGVGRRDVRRGRFRRFASPFSLFGSVCKSSRKKGFGCFVLHFVIFRLAPFAHANVLLPLALVNFNIQRKGKNANISYLCQQRKS